MSRSLQSVLNESNPNKLALAGQLMQLGDTFAKGLALLVSGAVVSDRLVLPEGRKAVAILYAYSRAGTVTGYLTPVLPTATLATGQVTISPTGDIEFFAADAVTAADVVYVAADGTIYQEDLPVVSNVATFPQSKRGIIVLSATATAGTSTGAKGVLDRGAAATAGNCSLRVDGTGVTFNGGDAVTSATIRYIAVPGVGTAPGSIADRLDGEVAL